MMTKTGELPHDPEGAVERLDTAVTRVEQYFQRLFDHRATIKADQDERQALAALTEEAAQALTEAMKDVRTALETKGSGDIT